MAKDARANLIAGRAKMSGLDIPQVAKKSGIPRSTLYSRLKHPGRLTLDELEAIDRVIGFETDEILTLAGRSI